MPKRDKSPLPESFIEKILEEIGQSTTGPFANFELDLDERRVVWLADFLVKKHGSRAEEMALRYYNDLKRKEFAGRVLVEVRRIQGVKQ